ncbi:MAG: outer membrane protein assembly factor [Pseudomonadota bacterium]|nr:outer membrane protein assembly factor [Pseudomonadota bacterium]
MSAAAYDMAMKGTRRRFGCAAAACLLVAFGGADGAADEVPAPDAAGVTPKGPPPAGFTQWFNPSTAPFIPVPLIGTDPNSGTTLGILPVWLKTDDNHQIRRIIAPDILHNPYFGYGIDGRLYAYSSTDKQWSVDAGIKQRVERTIDAEYQIGRLRDQRWSVNYSVIYDRSGVPRFYGIGNDSPRSHETNYTNGQELAQVQVGLNLNHDWQILYTGRIRRVDVTAGTLTGVPTLETRFRDVIGSGITNLVLDRVSVIYDTRDDLTVPSRGMEWIAYGGLASRSGILNDSMYSEAGLDGRNVWPVGPKTVLAAHVALRYLPGSSDRVPFWALSSIGGGESVTGGDQPLRGYGQGRFYDRNSFYVGAELRRTVLSFNAVSTLVDIEMAPFVDLGRVFSRTGTLPLEQLHRVVGVGFRGIARPFVVGKVDVGYGSEGIAIFTGLNYPF